MGTHTNAPLSTENRRRLVGRRPSRPIAHVAAETGLSRTRISKWVNRYRRHGQPGLHNRTSTPHRQPTATPGNAVERTEQIRRNHKRSAERTASELGQTAHAVSRRTVTRHLAREVHDVCEVCECRRTMLSRAVASSAPPSWPRLRSRRGTGGGRPRRSASP
ncbi:helix-turn-helix domain-containing protein [Streptomyces sp. NPDC002276]